MFGETAKKMVNLARFQDRAALLGIDPHTERILFATTELCGLSDGRSGGALLGCAIKDVLGSLAAHAIRNAQSHPKIERRRLNLGQFEREPVCFHLSVFRSEEVLVVEAIPSDDLAVPTAWEVLADVTVLSDALIEPGKGRSPFSRFASLMQTLSGYNCVAIEHFSESASMIVDVAGQEKFASGRIVSSPQLWSMQDVRRSSVGLVSQEGVHVPDLGLSSFTVPDLFEFSNLQELGIVACAAMDMKCGRDLWGRIKFFHSHPRLPSSRTQLAMAHLSPVIVQRLIHL